MSDQTTAAPTRKPCGCEWFNDPPAKIGELTVYPQSFKPCAKHATPQPAAPSTRVSEAELLELDAEAEEGDSSVNPNMIADGARRCIAEIRRYRALLLGVIARREQDGNPYPCPCCDQNLPHFAEEVCPWIEVEAEVQAIRAERR